MISGPPTSRAGSTRRITRIDGGHAAFAESTLDAVAVGESSGEVLGDFSHALRCSVCSVTLRSGPGLLVG